MVRTFAAIDVGSFELELGIYEITDKGNVRTVDQVKHMIALGKDTYHTGKISYRLVEEMCEVLQDFVRIMKEYQVKEYRAYATSAMREATRAPRSCPMTWKRSKPRARITSIWSSAIVRLE